MPGNLTLGCLLGQYDKAQSFDVDSFNVITNVNSWIAGTVATSYSFQNTNIHSSDQNIRCNVFSDAISNTGVLIHRYGEDNDAHERWFPDVTTHQTHLHAWIRQPTAANSGRFNIRIFYDGTNFTLDFVGRNTTPTYFTASAQVHSASDLAPAVQFRKGQNPDASAGSMNLLIDDILLESDRIIINPDYSFIEQARIIKTQHRTIGGKSRNFLWEKGYSWEVPLRYISTSHADLINWWWENQFNLLFMLNTSDSETLYTCRIDNQLQPIGSRMRPYEDQWSGTLILNSLNEGNLVF